MSSAGLSSVSPASERDEVPLSADLVLGSAAGLGEADQLTAESWASLWLGEAWQHAEGDGERAVDDLLRRLVAASSHPEATAVLSAFRLVAPQASVPLLTEALEALEALETGDVGDARDVGDGGDARAAAAGPPRWQPGAWRVAEAARYLDPWDCERFLVIVVDGPVPHCLLIAVDPSLGGVEFIRVMDVEHGRTFFADWPAALPPMRRDDAVTTQVLSEAADALRMLDATRPARIDAETAAQRALAWARCRRQLRPFQRREGLTAQSGTDVVRDFLGRDPDGAADSFCAELLLDFGEGYMHDPLAWSPHWVTRFLLDFVPRRLGGLERADLEALPGVLARWVVFALERRGVAAEWIPPVVAAVAERRTDFEQLMGEAD